MVGKEKKCVRKIKYFKQEPIQRRFDFSVKSNLRYIGSCLRTVPTIVIAHSFCASPDTRISYR